ncbi:unnamed protein product [Rhizoctonia solani]|uniref:Uncharacterized protein n=1 Tax=Rhizoctonia solani TaxID=456999 RepID=A0A8H3C596_9AGAM|nr:unnamed protein product [Rhizoctonia solani]
MGLTLITQEQAAVLEALLHLPQLCKLVVDSQSWIASVLNQEHKDDPKYEDWKYTIAQIAKQCCWLEHFETVEAWKGGGLIWKVIQDAHGDYQDVINFT